jgi:hypothetical protein
MMMYVCTRYQYAYKILYINTFSYIMLFKKLLNVYSLHHVHNVMYDIFDYSG